MSTDSPLWHERLHAYQRTLALYARAEGSILSSSLKVAATDHLERALESILENIATANSSWSIDARRQHFGVACGSALECAGCLDILRIRATLASDVWQKEKSELCRIVQMLVGLLRSEKHQVKEEAAGWGTEKLQESIGCFDHERLDVYQVALDFVRWVDRVIANGTVTGRHAVKLDSLSTSIVLNIAEGNGRFSPSDHRNFIDIARQSALKSLVLVDIAATRDCIPASEFLEAKTMLRRVVKMLLGMRGYLDRPPAETTQRTDYDCDDDRDDDPRRTQT